MKKVAILQSNYIPWKGYFDIINSVDEFIVLDEVQYTKRDWRNRNKIKTPRGIEWLSIPALTKGKREQRIDETKVEAYKWAEKHWKAILCNYQKAAYFPIMKDHFFAVYSALGKLELLSEINYILIREICNILEIKTAIKSSSEYKLLSEKTERLISICQGAGATQYISGPAANSYINHELFEKAGIDVQYYNYEGYPEYNQLYPPFEHKVTILDLIFNEGPRASSFMKSFKKCT